MDIGSLTAMGGSALVWLKWGLYTIGGGALAYFIWVYFFEYTTRIEYVKVMNNGINKEVKIRAKRYSDKGIIKYKLWRSDLILKRPDNFSFITMLKGRKEKLRILATAENQYYFLKLNITNKCYDAIPAEVEEYMFMAKEQLYKKYLDRKSKLDKFLVPITLGISAVVFIITVWLLVDLISAYAGSMSNVGDKIAYAADKMSQHNVPPEAVQTNLPN